MMDWAHRFEEVATDWRPDPLVDTAVVDLDAPSRFAALLDQPPPVRAVGDELPPLWHWFLHRPIHRHADLGVDGHPRKGGLLPPLPEERRRMFGGGRLDIQAPLRCGDTVTRTSELVSCRATQGHSGPLLLSTIRRALAVEQQICVIEEQDIVYLPPHEPESGGGPDARESAPKSPRDRHPDATWSLRLIPDPTLLFRFSALTANAHRIHYDRDFARETEGHPDLVVHGPLSALLLLELPRRQAPNRRVTHVEWRARQPAYVGQELVATGSPDGDRAHLALHTDATDRAVVAEITLGADTTQ